MTLAPIHDAAVTTPRSRERVAVDGPADPRDLAGDFGHRHVSVVRFADTDAMGHVNNALYLTYVESARVAWWFDVSGESIQREAGRAEGLILAVASVPDLIALKDGTGRASDEADVDALRRILAERNP